MELLKQWPDASTAADGPLSTRPWHPLRLVWQSPAPDGEAVIREILEALDVAERSLAACSTRDAELTRLETQVATLQLLYRDLSSTGGGRGRATAAPARLRPIARVSWSRP